ncbi:hypothetical protein CHS0354_030124 [Potamilus streckersoni]|uniref:Uncharacterized protein n=1 Tax=Potamilus streckersoni TaxID=2493646 RepID=A0AAE0W6P1_9BIVA|nr:hypothetical protein CHS0354_030124 [Potamilus streckersoni]
MMCGASAFTSAPKPYFLLSMTGVPSEQTAETTSHERFLSLKKSYTSFFTSAALVVVHDILHLQHSWFYECFTNGVWFALLCDQVNNFVRCCENGFVDGYKAQNSHRSLFIESGSLHLEFVKRCVLVFSISMQLKEVLVLPELD